MLDDGRLLTSILTSVLFGLGGLKPPIRLKLFSVRDIHIGKVS